MATVLRTITSPTLVEVTDAYLATLDHPESTATRRAYACTLRALRRGLGEDLDIADLDYPEAAAELLAWFAQTWGSQAPATYNRNLDTLRSAIRYWIAMGWMVTDPTRMLRHRRRAPDHSKALARHILESLLTSTDLALRERTLWRMLYETAARVNEVLSLDVSDLDRINKTAKVRRKGSAIDVIAWRTGTAHLLPRLIGTRTTGPLFLTERAARVALPSSDLDPVTGRARLSYRRAAELFEQASTDVQGGPWTLHQLRHSALTHAAEDGASTPQLLAYSGHTSVISLSRYTRLSPEALARWQDGRDPAQRRK